jgi:DNA-binding CsgD family transcriptional regulator
MAVVTVPGTPLTAREREISGLVVTGMTSRQIASRLGVSKRTVDSHLLHIYAKTGTGSRTRLVLWLMTAGRA